MNADVEFHIRQNYPWSKLPAAVKQSLGNSQREYEKQVVNLSIKNQLRHRGNLVRHVKKDERKYYEELLRYSREHLMLYPYHLCDVVVKGLRVTPFAYYTSIMMDIMQQEKSYDSLPNFTAADCLRLMGIGRNQYIDLMNQCRSSKKFFRKKPVKDLLPSQPIETVSVEPWWIVQLGYITEEDVKACTDQEKLVIDKIIDEGPQTSGDLSYPVIHGLYRRGLVYLDVPIGDEDCIIVPPLEGFVMNRVLGDYFETLLYKIFVSIDEHTTVAELSNVLQIDLQLVKNAVSMYCRLGFAKKKGYENNTGEGQHPSWANMIQSQQSKKPTQDQLLIDWTVSINEQPEAPNAVTPPDNEGNTSVVSSLVNVEHSKRIAFLFDSTLTAFLMMGNLSPGLKSHAVTMFEVGKLSDESLDSFINELEKVGTCVDSVAEGEAQRYFEHAITLRDTVKFLRYNREVVLDAEFAATGQGMDLLRCESLLGLDPDTCSRVLNKNYSLLVSMAPLSNEIRPVSSCTPQHLGPAIPEVNSVWFKLYLYTLSGAGPPSLLLVKGTRLRRLPDVFQEYDRLLVTTWGHDPGVIGTSNILLTLNDALTHSAVLVQGHGWHHTEGTTMHVAFPLLKHDAAEGSVSFEQHSAIKSLTRQLDLRHTCGVITLLRTGYKTCLPSAASPLPPSKVPPPKQAFNTPTATAASSRSNSPKNGIKDEASAEVLATELDHLEESISSKHHPPPASPDRSKLTLAVGRNKGSPGTSAPSSTDTDAFLTSGTSLEQEWTLLDCCYGIPLFNAHVNRQVCERIASHGLCNKDSLQELLHSSRKLSIDLLNFIAEHQDLPVLQENQHESGMIAQNSSDHMVPLPTHNLLFHDGQLSSWLNIS